jgi:hypothetical protein
MPVDVWMQHPTARFLGQDALELDEEARELFLDGNARRVFGL